VRGYRGGLKVAGLRLRFSLLVDRTAGGLTAGMTQQKLLFEFFRAE
jgi:hypothetical protein